MQLSDFLGRKYFIIILISVAVYSLFLFFSDFDVLYDGLEKFQITTIPLKKISQQTENNKILFQKCHLMDTL